MSADPKIDFYLANRALIEQWAALRPAAAQALDEALLAAASALAGDADVPEPQVRADPRSRAVVLPVTAAPAAAVTLEWYPNRLLGGVDPWPWVTVSMSVEEPTAVRAAVRAAAATGKDTHGLVSTGNQWLRFGPVPPLAEPIEMTGYAQHCIERLRAAFVDLAEPVRAAVHQHSPAT